MLVLLNQATTTLDRFPEADCNLLRRHGNHNIQYQLATATETLACVYHQWQALRVTTHPTTGKVVRVQGKQPDPETKKAQRDDVWMAFRIGMQWCARFTRLLPDAGQRDLLVDYMRRLTTTVIQALQDNLHVFSALSEQEDQEQEDQDTSPAVQKVPGIHCLSILSPVETEALVVVFRGGVSQPLLLDQPHW